PPCRHHLSCRLHPVFRVAIKRLKGTKGSRNMHKKWMVFTIVVGLLGSAFGVCAQESKQRKAEVEVFVQQNGPAAAGQKIEMGGDGEVIAGDNFVFVATEMSFGGRVVKGAPYSAEAVTESVQTLADGNRIVHKTTAQVYRD